MWQFDKVVIEASNNMTIARDQCMPTVSLESSLMLLNSGDDKVESSIKLNIHFWSTKVSFSFTDKTA